ncbi:hypothetical protein D5086_025348 [Populus alba]|uniref:Uncharacterized protein n=1 Tax=Populus alba TaxID=43335 RepID=A0ACC4AZE7_POPAL
MKLLSRKATCNTHGQDSSYFLGWQEYEKNPYDEIKNPTGIIQMGLAENQLSFDLLESWLANNQDAAGFKKDGQSIFRELALFQDYHGLPAFKKALVEFMAEIRGNKVTFDQNKIVLTAGATSANETLMFCLAEPGEAFLLPTPYYPGFDRDLKWRTGVEIVPIQWFVSVMEVLKDMKCESSQVWNRVHVVYSLSKDLGLPGFRVGAIYSNDDMVVSAATKMSSFGLVSSQTQYLLAALLSDKKFTRNYISENQKRLKQRQKLLVQGLQKAGISCLKSNASLFCWVNMKHLLSSNTFDAEMELWKKIVHQVKLNISPGSSCHCTEPGWFRVCFANMSEETLNLAIQRLKSFVESMNINNQSHHQLLKNSRRKSLTKWVLRLSFDHDREPEER